MVKSQIMKTQANVIIGLIRRCCCTVVSLSCRNSISCAHFRCTQRRRHASYIKQKRIQIGQLSFRYPQAFLSEWWRSLPCCGRIRCAMCNFWRILFGLPAFIVVVVAFKMWFVWCTFSIWQRQTFQVSCLRNACSFISVSLSFSIFFLIRPNRSDR